MPTAVFATIVTIFFSLFSLSSGGGARQTTSTPSTTTTTPSSCHLLQLRTCFTAAFQSLKITRQYKDEEKIGGIEKKNMSHIKTIAIPKNSQRCSVNQHFLHCFDEQQSVCSLDEAANMAAIVHNDLHGRLLSMDHFLTHRDFVLQLCTHKCSNESRQFCQRLMGADEPSKEHTIYLKSLVQAKQVFLALEKNWRQLADGACHKLSNTIGRLMFIRSEHCGDAAKCVCADHKLAMAVRECKIDCEETLLHIYNTAQVPVGRFAWIMSIISLGILNRA